MSTRRLSLTDNTSNNENATKEGIKENTTSDLTEIRPIAVNYTEIPPDIDRIIALSDDYTKRVNELLNTPTKNELLFLVGMGASLLRLFVMFLSIFLINFFIKLAFRDLLAANSAFQRTIDITTITSLLFFMIFWISHMIKSIYSSEYESENKSINYSKVAYTAKQLKIINSLIASMLQDEISLTKSDKLLLDLRNSESDEAIIKARDILKRGKWKDIP